MGLWQPLLRGRDRTGQRWLRAPPLPGWAAPPRSILQNGGEGGRILVEHGLALFPIRCCVFQNCFLFCFMMIFSFSIQIILDIKFSCVNFISLHIISLSTVQSWRHKFLEFLGGKTIKMKLKNTRSRKGRNRLQGSWMQLFVFMTIKCPFSTCGYL